MFPKNFPSLMVRLPRMRQRRDLTYFLYGYRREWARVLDSVVHVFVSGGFAHGVRHAFEGDAHKKAEDRFLTERGGYHSWRVAAVYPWRWRLNVSSHCCLQRPCRSESHPFILKR